MVKVQKIAEEQSADHILIHTEPQADLRMLAKTFTVADASGSVLSNFARIGSLVTVIDAKTFLGATAGTEARALFGQIELSNVVLLEGASGVSSEIREQIVAVVETLNATA